MIAFIDDYRVAFVIDIFARRIVGWRVGRTAHAGFILDTQEQSLHARRFDRGASLVHHSDRGTQYVSTRYTELLAEAGVMPPSAAWGTLTTMTSPRRSTVSTRPR